MAYVIAEIGFNHGGDLGLALEMVESASRCGASAVKFQSFTADDLYYPDHEAYPIFKAGEISKDDHITLKKVADKLNIDFLSTPFSIDWIEFLDGIGVPAFKVASMDVANPVLLEEIGRRKKRVFLSTGAATLEEVRFGVETLKNSGATSVNVMHCISNYPTKPGEANLSQLVKLTEAFGDDIGFSDHTLGVAVPLAAIALGAKVIEKHFTTDKNLPGPDNSIAADPKELTALIQGVKDVEAAISESKNRPDDSKRKVMRRSVYAASDIEAGEVVTLDNLRLLRPEVTPLAETLEKVVGKPAICDYKKGDAL